VSKRVHRRKDATWDGNRLSLVVLFVEDRIAGPSVAVDCSPLRLAQGARDVALLQWPTCSRSEHEAFRLGLPTALRCRVSTTASSGGIGTVRAEPSVFVGRRLPWPSICQPNSISASSESSTRRSAHVSPQSSEMRALVNAATVNSVRNGSCAAAIVCSTCSPVKIGRRLARETLGRSDGSISVVGIVPFHRSRRDANL
jgi:hypothetical protein